MGSASDNISSIGFRLYEILLRFIFIPLIKRYFDEIVQDARESLYIYFPDVNYTVYVGIRQQHGVMAGKQPAPVKLFLRKPIKFCFRILLDPKIGLGEAYMYKHWDVQPKIQDFLSLLIRAKRHNSGRNTEGFSFCFWRKVSNAFVRVITQVIRKVVSLLNSVQHYMHANSLRGSARNIRDHYDLGNEMFSLFLDPSMTYSCATFHEIPLEVTHSDSKLLEEAQMRKYDLIFNDLDIRSEDHVLEIGFGWGACATRAVKRYDCQWTGLTISSEQLKTAQQRVRSAGIQNKVNLKLLDYRLEKGVYDKVIAIEMIEAVGHDYLPQFFKTLCDQLRPGGKAFLQAITCPESYYERYRRSSDFIKKHIFPGGHMPSERAIREALPPELTVTKIHHIGHHYAPTLDLWYFAWIEREKDVLKLGYSSQFHRKWQFYFALCSTLFRYSHIDTVQMLVEKRA